MKTLYFIALGIFCFILSAPVSSQTPGLLNFSCATTAPSGNWGDKHVAALWIQNNEDPSVFIKTNAKYGHQDDHLTDWGSVSNKNLVDAVTGATLSSYETLSAQWDGTDVSGNLVPDGDYSVYIEMGWGKDKTNQHATSLYTFTKGSSSQQLTLDGDDNFSSINISWQPSTTSISNEKELNLISVYPNPSEGVINVFFARELTNVSIEVSDLSGKIYHVKNYENISLGVQTFEWIDLSQGLYIINVVSDEQHYSRKLLIH